MSAAREVASLPKNLLLVYRRKLTKAARSGHPGRAARARELLTEVNARIEKEYSQ